MTTFQDLISNGLWNLSGKMNELDDYFDRIYSVFVYKNNIVFIIKLSESIK